MNYPKTAELWNYSSIDVERIVQLVKSKAWELVHNMEQRICDQALQKLTTADDIKQVYKAQGIIRGFQERDGELQMIFDQAKTEEKEKKDEV